MRSRGTGFFSVQHAYAEGMRDASSSSPTITVPTLPEVQAKKIAVKSEGQSPKS